MRRRLLNALKIAFGLGLIALLLYQLEWRELAALAGRGEPRDFALSLLSFALALCGPQALRLHLLIRRHTGRLRVSYKIFFIGALFNNLLPSNVGGDAVRLLYLRNMGEGGVVGPLALLLVHRLSGLTVLVLGGACYLLLRADRLAALMVGRSLPDSSAAGFLLPVLALMVVLLVTVALLRSPRLGPRLVSLGQTALAALRRLSVFDWLGLALLTLGFHAMRLLGFVLAARFLGQQVDAFDLVFVMAVTGVAALVPLSIAGLGVVEGSISVLLAGFGMAPAAAISVALMHRVSLLVVALVGGLVYFATRGERAAAEVVA